MSETRVILHGESWISLETVAECYECETTWVREVYEHGLLGRGERYRDRVVVRTTVLDRFADIRRLVVYQGVSLEAVSLVLADEPDGESA